MDQTGVITADMHTHSEYSHDSVCPVSEMCAAQKNKGTSVFAVTDHCDVYKFKEFDIFTPIELSCKTAKKLDRETPDCTVLAGVEFSEGFWFPDQMSKIYTLFDFDVIIGSVHCVRYKEFIQPYSQIDFSLWSDEKIYGYLDAYFNDALVIARQYDMDILAHLTCPLRYIAGKYRRNVDLTVFKSKIEKVLKVIIERGIALEVNTSDCVKRNALMPDREWLELYHDLGGHLLTLGSDAHVASNASLCFEKTKGILKEIGFTDLYYYRHRQAVSYRI